MSVRLLELHTMLAKVADMAEDIVYDENSRGGEARSVVDATAYVLDVDLTHEPIDGDIWSWKNMSRVIQAARELKAENLRLQGRIESAETRRAWGSGSI